MKRSCLERHHHNAGACSLLQEGGKSLKVDYLVVYSDDADLKTRILESMQELIGDGYGEPQTNETLSQSVEIRYTRTREDGRRISGLTVDFDIFDINENEAEDLIRRFSKTIANSQEGIDHVLKLHDPALYSENQRYAEEIFKIEMKLREALSFIFIDTCEANFYELLKDIEVDVVGWKKDPPQESQMIAHCENQFYFLVFSDYIKLTNPKRPKSVDIFELIGTASNFDELKGKIPKHPIVKVRYKDFLASLKERVEPIEKLRNCVAHNRTISTKTLDDYNMVKEDLLTSIQGFLEEVGNTPNEEPDDSPTH